MANPVGDPNDARAALSGPAILRWSPAIFWCSATTLILWAVSAIDAYGALSLPSVAPALRAGFTAHPIPAAIGALIAAASLAGTIIQRKKHFARLGIDHTLGAKLSSDIATVGAAGLTPKGSGTAGAIAALPAGWALAQLDWPAVAAILIALTALTTFATARYLDHAARAATARGTAAHLDPGEIVVDEYVGVLIALAFVPWKLPWAIAAFLLFRAFDIAKPGPVGWADQKLHGAWGVMFDDVIAGLMAGIILALVRVFLTR